MNQTLVYKLEKFFPVRPLVDKVLIFGSYAQGEKTRKSEVNIMMRFDIMQTINKYIMLCKK